MHGLERQVEQLKEQLESDKAAHGKVLADKDRLVRELQDRVLLLEDALGKARK